MAYCCGLLLWRFTQRVALQKSPQAEAPPRGGDDDFPLPTWVPTSASAGAQIMVRPMEKPINLLIVTFILVISTNRVTNELTPDSVFADGLHYIMGYLCGD